MSEALDVMASLVLEDGRRWGEAALPFQWEDARAILDQTGPPNSALTRGRGGAKTSDLAGLNVAVGLTQAPRGARLYAAAADRDQGRLLVDSIVGYQARTPGLRGALEVGAFRVGFPRRDVVLEILAADAPSAWGLRPYFLTVDEVAQWPTTMGPRMLWEALSSALPKVPGSRCVLLTSAGDPAHWSRRLYDHAEASPLWRVNEVPGPVPWIPEDRLAEERRRLPESSYQRLHLNVWTASEDRLADPDDLAACTVLDGPLPPEPGRRYLVSLDVGLKHDRTVALVAHSDRPAEAGELPLVTVDRLEVWQGSREQPVTLDHVEQAVELACRSYNSAPLVFDPWQAIGLGQRLAARGVRTVEYPFSAQSVARIASNLFSLIRARKLALPDDPELLDELANVRLRETAPGVLRIDHDPDKHDDRAIALALAAFCLVDGSALPGAITQVCYLCGAEHEPGITRCAAYGEHATALVVTRGGERFTGAHHIDKPSPTY